MSDIIKLEHELEGLKREYAHIEQQIKDLAHEDVLSPFKLLKLKKDRLVIRDKIIAIEEQIYPDVIA